MLLNLYDFKVSFSFAKIIVFFINKGLQILLILKELTKLLHLKLTFFNCVELFDVILDLN